MIFNSHAFLLGFLPASFLLFVLTQRLLGWPRAFGMIGVLSLVFYAQLGLPLLAVLLVSVVTNYILAGLLINAAAAGRPARWLLAAGILVNLGALGYFKYTNFFIDIVNQATGGGFDHLSIILPIGISFYTFIQIGYLIEAHSGQAEHQPFGKYLAFATFFPCVTAGPLVLQREIFDQMKDRTDSALNFTRIAAGVTVFSIGLFKKVVIADSIAPYADTVFDGVAAGQGLDAAIAWTGALAYSLQLYFDFSGYSDMAIGLGAIFGILLPLNFNSPFKATSISEFWQRWHMTMTRFFTTYVFTPLAIAGMRKANTNGYGALRKYIASGGWPIVLTMLVAGIWHGSGWVFVIYGLIHGIAIAINNGWRALNGPRLPTVVGWMLTMSVVVSGLVVFRSPDVVTAAHVLASMWSGGILGNGGAELVELAVYDALPLIALLSAIVLIAPNAQEITRSIWLTTTNMPARFGFLARRIAWRPALGWSAVTACVFVVAFTMIGPESEFLYYKF